MNPAEQNGQAEKGNLHKTSDKETTSQTLLSYQYPYSMQLQEQGYPVPSSALEQERQILEQNLRSQNPSIANDWINFKAKENLHRRERQSQQSSNQMPLQAKIQDQITLQPTPQYLPMPSSSQIMPAQDAQGVTKEAWYNEDTGNYFEPQLHSARQPAIEYVDWSKRTLHDCRAELARRNLKLSGSKAEVVARLQATDHQYGKSSVDCNPEPVSQNMLTSGHKLAGDNTSYQAMVAATWPGLLQGFGGHGAASSQYNEIASTSSTPGPRGFGRPVSNPIPTTKPALIPGIIDPPVHGDSGSKRDSIMVSNNHFSALDYNRQPSMVLVSSQYDDRLRKIQQVNTLLEELRNDPHSYSVKALAKIADTLKISNEKEENADREYLAFRTFIDGYKSWKSFPPNDPNAKVCPWVAFGEVHNLVCFHFEEGMESLVERMEGLEATVGLKNTSPPELTPFGGTFQQSFMKIDNTITNMEERLGRVEEYLCGIQERESRGATRFVDEGCPPVSKVFVRQLLKDVSDGDVLPASSV